MLKSGRLNPPSYLGRREKRLFKEVVGCFDADYFNAGCLPLLTAYVIACVQSRDADAELREEGCVVPGSRGALRVNPWHQINKQAVATMMSMGTKLRITPSSRLRTDDATSSAKKAASGKVFAPESDWRDYQEKTEH